MACTSPLKGWVLGRDVATGKKIIKVTSRFDIGYPGHDSFLVPCGNCMACRLEYSRQWANRCMMEMQYHERACFITLTYDDFHVPRRFYRPKVRSTMLVSYSLFRRDVQLFLKRLRKAFPSAHIRFFGCGEYGPNTLRPHYHIILFGIDFDDKVPFTERKSKTNQDMFVSEHLNKLWSFPPRLLGESYSPDDGDVSLMNAGLATVQPVTWETCAYTARYVTKKLKGELADFYKERNMDPPFCMMSRRPGIGRQFYDDHPDLWDYDFINVSTPDGGKKFRPPKYFVKLYEQDEPELAEAMKEVRKAFALEHEMLRNSQLQIDPDSYLDLQADVMQDRINMLGRNGVK